MNPLSQTTNRVRGKISPGHGVASGQSGDTRYPGGTLKAQYEYFKERGLDLSPFYLGTINVDISPLEYQIANPKLFLQDVNWSDFIPAENFYFFDLKVYTESGIYQGLVYMPDPATKVEHEQGNTILELILPKIPNLQYGDQIDIEVPSGQMTFQHSSE